MKFITYNRDQSGDDLGWIRSDLIEEITTAYTPGDRYPWSIWMITPKETYLYRKLSDEKSTIAAVRELMVELEK